MSHETVIDVLMATTGEPKGVMLSHENVLWMSLALKNEYSVTPEDCGISYLPSSHIAEQVISHYLPLVVGGCMSFAQSLETLGEDLREVRPTFFFAVPRVWEKIQARMEAAGATSSPLRRRLVRWSREIGLIDEDGFLYVTDRKKELLITSGGKNVAPVPIESKLKRRVILEVFADEIHEIYRED